MPDHKLLILNQDQIAQKVKRIAYQILEDNHNAPELCMAGISKNGYLLAEWISKELRTISSLKITLIELTLDKKNPTQSKVSFDPPVTDFENKIVIIVDDVLESGRTMAHAMRGFLQFNIKKLRTVVLVNRNHKKFPITADYCGLSISTTLQDHVYVEFNDPVTAYLG